LESTEINFRGDIPGERGELRGILTKFSRVYPWGLHLVLTAGVAGNWRECRGEGGRSFEESRGAKACCFFLVYTIVVEFIERQGEHRILVLGGL